MSEKPATSGHVDIYLMEDRGYVNIAVEYQRKDYADGFFAANYLGVNAFAAINLVFPLIMIFAAPGFMIGSGGNAIISKIKGEGRLEQARKYFTMLVFVLLVNGIVCGVLM